MGWFRYVLLIANVGVLLGVLTTPLLLFVSGFFFDDPKAVRDPFVYGMFLAVWSYPITATYGGIHALRSFKAGDSRKMARWTLCSYSSIIAYFFFGISDMFCQLIREMYFY